MRLFHRRSWLLARLPARLPAGALCFLLCLLAGVALLPRRALAVGEITGRLGGYVVIDATGDGLAGVKLTIRSPALIGGAQSRVTNDDGSYIFQNLPPGTYELTANIEGFTPVLQRNIVVNAGQQSPVDIRLQIQATPQPNETYKIVEKQNPVLNPESATSTTTLNNEELTRAPSFRQAQSVAQLAPGVTQGSDQVSVRGGLGRNNRFLIDGLDTTDIVTGGITSPVNFDAIEQITVTTGAMDAEYNSLGLVQNLVSRSGGNKFTVDASVILEPTFVSASTRFPARAPLPDQGLLYDASPQTQRAFYSGNLNLGGPIVKDRLWYYVSFQVNYNRQTNLLTALPWHQLPDQYARYMDTYTYLGRAKLTWQATASTRISLSFNIDRNFIRNATSGDPNLLAPEAARRIDRGGEWVVLLWDTLITPKLLFQLQTGVTFKGSQDDTLRHDPGSTVPDHLNAAHSIFNPNPNDPNSQFNGVSYINSANGWNIESKWNLQVSPSLLYTAQGLGGTHNIKGGVQFSYQRYDHNVGIPGGAVYSDLIAGLPCDPNNPLTFSSCSQVTVYPDSAPKNGQPGAGFSSLAQAINIGFYIQDRYTLLRWLSIVPGMRVDVGLLYNSQGSASLVGYGPRLSVIYDLLHDRSTLLEAHYGRHNDVGNAFIADQANPHQLSILQRWNPATNSFDPNGKVSGGAGGQQAFASSYDPPKVDEVGAGVHREVFPKAVVGVDYTYRKYQNFWVNQEVNQVWDPEGTRVVGYLNGKAQRIFQPITPDDAQRTYHGLDLWLQGNPGNWNITASYTLAFANGTVTDYFPASGYLYNPRLNSLFQGPLPDNYRHYLKAFTDYFFSFGLDIGVRFQYLSGSPQWQVFNSPEDRSYTLYRSPRGSDTGTKINDPTTWASFNLPDQVDVDLQVGYNLTKLTKQNIDIIAMLFNAINLNQATFVDNRFGPTFGQATSRPSNIFAEFVLRYRY